jgi:WD40 repeat protein
MYAAPLVRSLVAAGWAPAEDRQRARFDQIARLAGACQAPPPLTPTLSRAWSAHQRTVTRVAFSPDGELLASGGTDGAARLWHVAAGQPAGSLRHPWAIDDVAFSHDGRHLVSASPVGALRLWHIHAHAVGRAAAAALEGRCPAVFLPGGELLASAEPSGAVRLWRLPDGAPAGEFRAHTGRVATLAASPDGLLLATASANGLPPGARPATVDHSLRLWRVPDALPAGMLDPGAGRIEQLLFSPSGRLLSAGERLRLWDVPPGMLIAELDGRAPAAFGVGESIAAAGPDGAVYLWRSPGSAPPVSLEEAGHGSPRGVTCLEISGDGRLLAAGGADGTLRLWLLPEGRLLGVLSGIAGAVTSVAFSGDGRLLAAGGADGTLRLWRVGVGALCLTLSGQLTATDLALTRELAQDGGATAAELPWLALILALGAAPCPREVRRGAEPRVIAAGVFDIVVDG